MKPIRLKALACGLAAAGILILPGCDEAVEQGVAKQSRVVAEIAGTGPQSRSCVDGATLGLDFVGMLWEPADEIGIYGTADNNVKFVNEATSNQRKTTFSGQSKGMIQYAYFPWSADNDGVAVTALKGTLPAEQKVSAAHHVEADYKYGTVANGALDTEVRFNHLLSLARLEISAEGTGLSGETLKSVTFTASRGSEPVKLSGDFNFNATDGSVDYTNTTGTSLAAVWDKGLALNASTTAFISVFPTLATGDVLSIKVLTDRQEVSFRVTVGVNFAAGNVYTFPLNIKTYENKAEYGWESKPSEAPDEWGEGTFTCASLNVDGLPQKISGIAINKDGPGEAGTKLLAQAVMNSGWDFFGVSEDFEYNKALYDTFGSTYSHGEWRGSISASQLVSTADTDGLNFFWKNTVQTSEAKEWIVYVDAYGGLTGGANTCIKKGFRRYEVTLAGGAVVDVYITHMNTYSGDGNTESNKYVKAVLGQLRQLRDYVLAKMSETKRPAIVMGDTNMRYTRHNIGENLVTAIPDGITFNDPWVDFYRGGVYPSWDSKSLMIRSKFAGDKNDIVCNDDQRGEVVDKIWYFNYSDSDVKIEAVEFGNDVSDNFVKSTEKASYSNVQMEDASGNVTTGNVEYTKKIGLADHFPVVAKFKYTYRKR